MLADIVVAAVRPSIVGSGGVVGLADAHRELVAMLGGSHLGDGSLRGLLDDALGERQGPLTLLPGDRVADAATLAERLVLTHRVSDQERASAALDLDPDLGALAPLADVDGGLHLPDGTPLHRVDQRDRGAGPAGTTRWDVRLQGPDGWLDGCAPGRLTAVRVAGGIVHLDGLDDADAGPAPAGFDDALGELFDACNEGDGLPVTDEELLLLAAADRPEWFAAPRAPFGELVAAAGYEVCGRYVGRPGSWEEQRKVVDAVGTAARHIDLPHDSHATLAAALDTFDGWRRDPGVSPPSALARRLTVAWPAALALVEELRRRGASPHELDGFASALAAATVGTTPVPGWLASCAASLDGRPLDAERLATEALDLEPGFPPAAEEAAWHATDRGRAREAVNLLHRIRYPDDSEVESLRHMASVQSPDVGRNAPCPCGSGRKFKQCHLGRVEPPEADRVRWLLDKARTYLLRAAPPELLDDTVNPHEDDEDGLHLAAMDVLLFDGGWLERFLDARRPLLDDWEVAVAERWQRDHVASVFRVDAVEEGGRHHLADTATGTTRAVEPSPVLDPVAVHRLVWCRLVPVDDRWSTSGMGRLAKLSERAGILDAWAPGTPVEARIEALCRRKPDRPQSTSGRPPLACSTTIEPAAGLDAAAVADRLDGCLEREEPGGPTWVLVRDIAGTGRAILATVSRTAAGLVATSDSAAEHEELLGRLRDVLGEMTVVADERVPVARRQAVTTARKMVAALRRVLDRDDLGVGGEGLDADLHGVDELDGFGEVTEDGDVGDLGPGHEAPEPAALGATNRTLERRWTDVPRPVLGGRTPREAAGDSALRPDLLTLLAELEDQRGGVDVDRLRRELGLTGP